MSAFKLGKSGQLEGIPQHDRVIRCLRFGDGEFEVQMSDESGNVSTICFTKVTKLAVNNIREGNIVDRFYVWKVSEVPDTMRARLRQVFEIPQPKTLVDSGLLISLECIYGAELFALIDTEDCPEEYVRKLRH